MKISEEDRVRGQEIRKANAVARAKAKHRIRDGRGGTKLVSLSRKDLMSAFCRECMGWEGSPKTDCVSPLCPLYPYRSGAADPSYVPISDSEAEKYL